MAESLPERLRAAADRIGEIRVRGDHVLAGASVERILREAADALDAAEEERERWRKAAEEVEPTAWLDLHRIEHERAEAAEAALAAQQRETEALRRVAEKIAGYRCSTGWGDVGLKNPPKCSCGPCLARAALAALGDGEKTA